MISFGVEMKDGVSQPSAKASEQVAVLSSRLRSLQSAITKAYAVGDSGKVNKLASEFGMVSSRINALGGAAAKAGKPTTSLASSLFKANIEAKVLEEAADLAKAAVQGLADAMAWLAKTSIQVADERRQLTTTFEALGSGGRKTVEMLDRLSDRLPFTTSQLGQWGKALAEQGQTGARLEKGIRAAASAVALMGDEAAGAKVSNLLSSLARGEMTGKSVKDIGKALRGVGVNANDVASSLGVDAHQLQAMIKSGQGLGKIGDAIEDALIRKGKGAIASYGMSWDAMTKKAHEAIGRLFEGVGDTEGFKAFVASLQTVINLLGQTSSTGKAAKSGVTAAMGAAFGVAAKFITLMTVGALRMASSMLRFYIAMWPTLHRIGQMWHAAQGAKQVRVIWDGLVTTATLLAKGVWNLARPFVYMAGAVVALIGGLLWLVGKAGPTVGKIWAAIKKPFAKAYEWFSNLGGSIVDGLINGIKGRTKDIGSQMTALATTMKDATKTALDSHSPSRVFMRIGSDTAEGFAQGVSSRSSRVQDASRSMAGDATKGAQTGAAGRAGGVTVRIERGAIVIEGAGRSAADVAEEVLVQLAERIGLSVGLPAGT